MVSLHWRCGDQHDTSPAITPCPDLPALARIDTPALIIDEVALQSNIERMAATAAAHRVALRPHAKTHKSAAIALRQLKAGAIGIACATLLEAKALAAAGVTGLLVTSPVVGADKAARLARLNRVSPVAVVVDHRGQLEGLRAALADGDPPLGVLVDVDVGQGRTGVTRGGREDAVGLQRQGGTPIRCAVMSLTPPGGSRRRSVPAALDRPTLRLRRAARRGGRRHRCQMQKFSAR
jgi:D-serine deaminase-like pyridoxal phosphate-dependent protein